MRFINEKDCYNTLLSLYDFTLLVVFLIKIKIKNTLFSSALYFFSCFVLLHFTNSVTQILSLSITFTIHLNGFHSSETMKHTGKFHYPPLSITSHDSDLQLCPKPKTPKTTTRFKKFKSSSNAKRSRPETPLLKWKIHDKNNEEKEKPSSPVKLSRRTGRNVKKQTELGFSARRLAAGLWRLQHPEMVVGGSQKRFGFQVNFKPFWFFFLKKINKNIIFL